MPAPRLKHCNRFKIFFGQLPPFPITIVNNSKKLVKCSKSSVKNIRNPVKNSKIIVMDSKRLIHNIKISVKNSLKSVNIIE
jgi:hypothetical protein